MGDDKSESPVSGSKEHTERRDSRYRFCLRQTRYGGDQSSRRFLESNSIIVAGTLH